MTYSVIETKFIAPTDYKPARIKAVTLQGRPSDGKRESITVSISSESSASISEQHEQVARKLLPQVCNDPENVRFVVGGTDRGYVFVIVRN